MADPQTVNIGLFVPNTGADVDTWGSAALNPDFIALDGALAGVQAISVSNVPITLTSPAGFVPTPGGGPTQAQNRVLRFTGTQTGNVVVTLPLPGAYIIDNRTRGAFALQFRGVGVSEVVAVQAGAVREIYNDGSTVRFTDMSGPGAMEMWAGLASLPLWVGFCTIQPWLVCDGTIYSFSSFPALGDRLGSTFGGDGVTTFGVPDLRGRVPIAYDGTASRITVAGCGLNGQVLGSSLDQQTVSLVALQIPTITSANPAQIVTVSPSSGFILVAGNAAITDFSSTPGSGLRAPGNTASMSSSQTFNGTNAISVSSNNTGGQPHPNVQPSQVTGIWVIKT